MLTLSRQSSKGGVILEDRPRPQYSGPASDRNLDRLTLRRYTRHRSVLVDRWLHYADSEGFSTGGRQVMGGASHV